MKMIKDSKLLLKIFSGLIAVVLWFAVTYTEDPSISQYLGRLDTVFNNEETLTRRNLIIVNKDELPSFSVTVRGRRSKVISSLENVFASINVGAISSPGTHEVSVDYLYPTDSVMLTKAKLNSVNITVEKLVSCDVPVVITAKPGKKNKSYVIESKANVEKVRIFGAQSIISKIDHAHIVVEESEITTNGTANYTYELYDADGNVLEERNIATKSHETITVTHTVHKKTELPVQIVLADGLENDYTLEIKEQNIQKLAVGIDEDTEIKTLEAVFERKHLSSDEETLALTLEIKAPDGVFIPEDSREVKIKCSISRKNQS